MPIVCDVEPSRPAYGPLPHFGIAITPTFETPTFVTNFFTSEPAVIVIAALPVDPLLLTLVELEGVDVVVPALVVAQLLQPRPPGSVLRIGELRLPGHGVEHVADRGDALRADDRVEPAAEPAVADPAGDAA